VKKLNPHKVELPTHEVIGGIDVAKKNPKNLEN